LRPDSPARGTRHDDPGKRRYYGLRPLLSSVDCDSGLRASSAVGAEAHMLRFMLREASLVLYLDPDVARGAHR